MAELSYTGGTTGRPKGVMISKFALWSGAMSCALDLPLDQNCRYLHAAPTFHLADGTFTIIVTILSESRCTSLFNSPSLQHCYRLGYIVAL